MLTFTDDPEDAELTRAIIAMAQALNMAVLAEGIEYADQHGSGSVFRPSVTS